ncbi:armadillo-type protein [Baffinella frigidus]|nr:armadillo-type protein [Cryptophyta sp. CCMP2293]
MQQALVALLCHEDGSHPVCASAANLIAVVCFDVTAALQLGQVPGMVAALAVMFTSGENFLRDPALYALVALSQGPENLKMLGEAEGVHDTLLTQQSLKLFPTLQQQSLKLFPVAVDFLCRLLPDPRICNNTVQARGVLQKLLETLSMPKLTMVIAALHVLRSIAASIEASWEAANGSNVLTEEEAEFASSNAEQASWETANGSNVLTEEEVDFASSDAEQGSKFLTEEEAEFASMNVEQAAQMGGSSFASQMGGNSFALNTLASQMGGNSFALNTLVSMLRRAEPGVAVLAMAALRSTLHTSEAARVWAVQTPDALAIIVEGLGSFDQEICCLAVWAMHDIASFHMGAQAVSALGVFTKIKVLLYCECAVAVKIAAIHTLKNLLLGMGRVVTPHEELVR